MRTEQLTKCCEPLQKLRVRLRSCSARILINWFKKVQAGKDQEKIPTPKTEVGKNQTNNQALIP